MFVYLKKGTNKVKQMSSFSSNCPYVQIRVKLNVHKCQWTHWIKLNDFIYSNLYLYSTILKLISMLVIQTAWDGAMKIARMSGMLFWQGYLGGGGMTGFIYYSLAPWFLRIVAHHCCESCSLGVRDLYATKCILIHVWQQMFIGQLNYDGGWPILITMKIMYYVWKIVQ